MSWYAEMVLSRDSSDYSDWEEDAGLMMQPPKRTSARKPKKKKWFSSEEEDAEEDDEAYDVKDEEEDEDQDEEKTPKKKSEKSLPKRESRQRRERKVNDRNGGVLFVYRWVNIGSLNPGGMVVPNGITNLGQYRFRWWLACSLAPSCSIHQCKNLNKKKKKFF